MAAETIVLLAWSGGRSRRASRSTGWLGLDGLGLEGGAIDFETDLTHLCIDLVTNVTHLCIDFVTSLKHLCIDLKKSHVMCLLVA